MIRESTAQELVEAMLAATDRGQIEWSTNSVNSRIYEFAGEHGGAQIFSHDGDDHHPFTFELTGPDGNPLDSYTTEHGTDEYGNKSLTDASDLLSELHAVAKDSALGVTKVATALLGELRPKPAYDMDEEPF